MRDFEYFEPATINEAISLLVRYGKKAKVLAGGTDLLVAMKQGVVNPDCLVSIKRIPSLNHISYDGKKGFKIGALATLREVESSPLVQEKIDVLAQAAHKVGAARIRNLGTIVGNLCQDVRCLYYPWAHLWRRAPCYRARGNVCYAVKGAKSCQAMATSDIAPALITLEASVSAVGLQGERTIPIEKFFAEAGVTTLQEGEILTGIEIANPPPHTWGVYLKHSVRGVLDFALAGVAVVLTLDSNGGACNDAKIGLIGVARTPIRASKAEGMLKGERIEDNLIDQAARAASGEVRPIGDIHGSATYRRRMVNYLVKRAMRQALDIAKKV